MERRMPPPAQHEPMPRDEPSGSETPDLVSIGLAVFFVSVILVVGALLVVPAVL